MHRQKLPVRKRKVPRSIDSEKTVEPPKKSSNEPEKILLSDVKIPRAPRKKVTIETHLEKYDTLLNILDAEIERKQKEREKGIRLFRTVRKMVRELNNEAPKIANAKRKMAPGGKKVSGFVLRCRITDELTDFMKLNKGDTPSRNEITNAICTYARLKEGEKRPQILKWAHLNPGGKRNLQDPEDKMSIIPDETLSKLLDYENYKARVLDGKVTQMVTDKKTRKKETVVVTDPSLRYWVIQRLYQHQIIETLKIIPPPKELEE